MRPTASSYGPPTRGANELELVMRRLVRLVLALSTLFPSAAIAAVPAPRATVRGTIVDPSRAAIVGAKVTAVPTPQGLTTETTTDDRGSFSLILSEGQYVLTVAAPGFATQSQPIMAAVGDATPLEFVLQLAGYQDRTTVTAPTGYAVPVVTSATRTATPLRDVPQSITVVTNTLMKDQLMLGMGDVVRYVPGMAAHQGENNRDQVVIRGNSSSADFFVNGIRDDVQYYRDLYNLDRVEALKGPNAMIFGRGGGGGVINRVTKQALFTPMRAFTAETGAWGHARFSGDLDQPLSDSVALRFNGVYEHSDSFRDNVDLERAGFNPTASLSLGDRTTVTLGYEFLHDTRVADRGITSYQGRPADVGVSTYYGNPRDSHVRATVNLGTATIEHRFGGGWTLTNRTLIGDYDRGYQNYVPGAASADKSLVAITAYNNATQRLNLFNQTDLTKSLATGSIRHTLLVGTEFGRQLTDNFRNTGYFGNVDTSIQVPYDNPLVTTPVTFRQSLTDADNHLTTNVAAAYVQDQAALSSHVDVIGGLRFDRFDLNYTNNRNADQLGRVDNLVSPRAGVVVKPVTPVSLYANYGVSYLPSSGDQFSSLTVITQQVEPEKFTNYEVGAKWDVRPLLSLTTAVYRLNRTNTRSTDPNDPTRIVQTGSQRTNGYEIGVNGQLTPDWSIAGGYAWQDAFVTSATVSAKEGAQVGQVPHHTVSLWNNYRVHPRVAVGVGVLHRTDMFAAIDNTVVVPSYTRVDGAVFVTLTRALRLQANLENLSNARYFINADSNTNISPGSPRALRIALTTAF
jgi:catecholate siderophore receptor